jgi:hypothetical protein
MRLFSTKGMCGGIYSNKGEAISYVSVAPYINGVDQTQRNRMPRYRFDLVDHNTVEDKGGRVPTDDLMAFRCSSQARRRITRFVPNCAERVIASSCAAPTAKWCITRLLKG